MTEARKLLRVLQIKCETGKEFNKLSPSVDFNANLSDVHCKEFAVLLR